MTVEILGPRIVGILRRSMLFKEWAQTTLEEIASRFDPRSIQEGTVLCREGDVGEEMYVVEEGRFLVETIVGEQTVRVAELGPGAVIGEMAVLSGQPRTATVTALAPSQVWVLHRTQFQALMREYPEAGVTVARIMAARLSDVERLHLANEKVALFNFTAEKDVVTIGRDDSNDIVLSDPQVSRIHAVIQRAGTRYQIVDLNSENGTYLNGERVGTHALADGDTIWIGTNPVFFDRSAIMCYSRGGGVKLDAVSLTKSVGNAQINLNDVSLSIYPGELVAIVGGSGTGKTTLLNALNGFRPATSGRVLYNGVDYYEHFHLYRTTLGYVPQDDIVHTELSVHQTLYYAARLRLPRDTTDDEIQSRIDEVLEELELTERRHTEVRRLSGGQRKRVSIGVELLTRPGIFFLDEPTSGLDPGLDGRMMGLFRRLANGDRTVVITTHATKHITMCDRVAFMAPGGYLAFYGTPSQALAYFGVEDFIDIYGLLEFDDEPETWAQRFATSESFHRNVRQRLEGSSLSLEAENPRRSAPARARLRSDSLRQLAWLSARYLSVLRHDPALLALFLLQAPIIACTIAITFGHSVFAISARSGGDAREAITMLFTLAVASVWLGANNASSAITSEIPIFARERHINLRVMPYILSKIWILGLFSLVQSALLTGIIAAVITIPGGPSTLLAFYAALALTNLVGLAMGLAVSSISQNSLQATAIVVTLLIPQLILAGSSVPISQVTVVGKIVALAMISRWSLSLLGFDIGMNHRLDAQLIPGTINHFHDQFAINPSAYAAILLIFFALFLTGAIIIQSRKERR